MLLAAQLEFLNVSISDFALAFNVVVFNKVFLPIFCEHHGLEVQTQSREYFVNTLPHALWSDCIEMNANHHILDHCRKAGKAECQ